MVSGDSVNGELHEDCKYVTRCGKTASDRCQGCGQIYCIDHYLKHQNKLQKQFEHMLNNQDLLSQRLKSFISQLSADAILDLIKQIYEFKMKSDEVEKTMNILQQQLQALLNDDRQDLINQLSLQANRSESDQNCYFENDILRLRKDIKQLKLNLKEIYNYAQITVSQEDVMSAQSNSQSDTNESPLSNLVTSNKNNQLQHVDGTPKNSITERGRDSSARSKLLLKQVSPSILDINDDELNITEIPNGTYPGEEEEMIGVFDSNTAPSNGRKVRLANNIVTYLRGPLKVMVDGTMHAVEAFTEEAHASDNIVKIVNQGLAGQKQIAMKQEDASNPIKPAFEEVTSDWKYEGKNADRGFSSISIWMRNPQGRRILIKIQDHPLSAANEWLAYALGKLLGLPVNEAQIGIYQNALVSLHTDVAHENEKTLTLMDLPNKLRKTLLTDPIIKSMDLFDHIIQNVDRNPRNILITMPNTATKDDETTKMKVSLIDHGSCFGMGTLNGISVVATKLRCPYLSVISFDPIEKARKFEKYLNKIPVTDRILLRKTLNHFAAITDDQFDSLMIEVQDLLSVKQYNRIRSVLCRQRDIVKRYMVQWGISPRSSDVQSNGTTCHTFETNDTMDYF